MTVPTTTVASSSAKSRTVLPTSSNSPMDRLMPAVMLTRMPLAPARSISSSKGLLMAASAASRARCSPLALPVPIIACPISAMTVLMSAKSTLMRPGQVMSSAIPWVAFRSTSLAALKAFKRLISLPSTASSFSLGMVMRESTCSASSEIPSIATCIRLEPSNAKGLVTTATVRMPRSRAIWATIGAAPVPVPPPMPAVMKTMSAPSRASWMRSLSSNAASLPTLGSAPAPSPLVMSAPSWRMVLTLEFFRAWESVLAQMKSTPSMAESTIWLMALPPPPPTPITLMTASWPLVSMSSNIGFLLSYGVILF